jgi:hypothetical protein
MMNYPRRLRREMLFLAAFASILPAESELSGNFAFVQRLS